LVFFNLSEGLTVTKTIPISSSKVISVSSSKSIPTPSKIISLTTIIPSKVVTTTTLINVIPSASKVITTSTTTTSSKVTSTTTSLKKVQRCPVYCILGKDTICSQNGSIFTDTIDNFGCPYPICTYITTTSSKAIPSASKIVAASTTASSKIIPSVSKILTTTATSTKVIPSSTKSINQQNCPRYTVNTQSCINKGGVFTLTINAIGCKVPTCIYPETTTITKTVPTTTKIIPTSTTTTKIVSTTTKTVPTSTSTCKDVVVTVTKKEKVTVTLKETITITVGSAPTNGATKKCV